jgi:phosphatidylglycerophosphatase C
MPEMNPTPPVEVAAFDFDGTLTRSDTLGPFLRRALGWPRYLWVLLRCSPWLAAYVLRLMSNHRAKARLLQVALAGWTREQAERHAQNFVHDFLPGFWHPWGLAQLLQHQHAGHRCVIVSASPGLYLHAVGKSLGVDAVLCTEMEVVDGRYTGRMATANCHGEEKVRRLRAWLTAQSGPDATPVLHAYGDTGGDKPMLRLAGHAWYRGRPWQPPSP